MATLTIIIRIRAITIQIQASFLLAIHQLILETITRKVGQVTSITALRFRCLLVVIT